jgi:hypothetical protein
MNQSVADTLIAWTVKMADELGATQDPSDEDNWGSDLVWDAIENEAIEQGVNLDGVSCADRKRVTQAYVDAVQRSVEGSRR